MRVVTCCRWHRNRYFCTPVTLRCPPILVGRIVGVAHPALARQIAGSAVVGVALRVDPARAPAGRRAQQPVQSVVGEGLRLRPPGFVIVDIQQVAVGVILGCVRARVVAQVLQRIGIGRCAADDALHAPQPIDHIPREVAGIHLQGRAGGGAAQLAQLHLPGRVVQRIGHIRRQAVDRIQRHPAQVGVAHCFAGLTAVAARVDHAAHQVCRVVAPLGDEGARAGDRLALLPDPPALVDLPACRAGAVRHPGAVAQAVLVVERILEVVGVGHAGGGWAAGIGLPGQPVQVVVCQVDDESVAADYIQAMTAVKRQPTLPEDRLAPPPSIGQPLALVDS